jgi:hypothetical protein
MTAYQERDGAGDDGIAIGLDALAG